MSTPQDTNPDTGLTNEESVYGAISVACVATTISIFSYIMGHPSFGFFAGVVAVAVWTFLVAVYLLTKFTDTGSG